jgi:hypothetical protein
MEKRLLLMFFVISLSVGAQTYVPMPLKNSYWTITYQTWQIPGSSYTGPYYSCYYKETYAVYPYNDTIISSKKYVKFYRKFINDVTTGTNCTYTFSPSYTDGYLYALRQDTLAQKIYYVPYNQTAEKLLYNFTYVAGDSVKTALATYSPSPPCNPSVYRIINSVSTVTLGDGLPHRIYALKPYTASCSGVYPFHDTIIEGVGNEVGLAETLKSAPYPGPIQTTIKSIVANCLVVNNTTTIYNRGAANCNYPLKISGIEKIKPELYPNPVTEYLHISDLPQGKVQIIILNALGVPVKELESAGERMDLKEISAGLYFLRLKTNDEYHTLKFIKE